MNKLLAILLVLTPFAAHSQADPEFEKATGVNTYIGEPTVAPRSNKAVEVGWVRDSSAWFFYDWTNDVWVKATANGEKGADGKTVLNGAGTPDNATGKNGDFYLNTDTYRMHGPKAGGTWGNGYLLTGPPGPAGPAGAGVVIVGTVPEADSLPNPYGGNVGDMFITEDNGGGYVYNQNGTYTYVGPIRGAQGVQGDQGAQGNTGADGQAAVVNVGTTTTSAPGSNADVINSGTTSSAILNFTIPRGVAGVDGSDGANGTGWTAGSYNTSTGVITFTSSDGLGFVTGDLRGADGTNGSDGTDGVDGNGIASTSYNTGTGQLTITFDDASTFTTSDLRGANGLDGVDGADGINGQDGNGIASTSYNSGTGVLTITYDDASTFSTADLRGSDGPEGPSDWNAIPNVPDSVVYSSELTSAQQAAEDYADANDDTREFFKAPTAVFRKYYTDSTYALVSEESVSGKGVEGVTSINGVPHIVTRSGDVYKVPKATGPSGVSTYTGSVDIRFPYAHVGIPYFSSNLTVTVGDSLATIGDRTYFTFTTDGTSFPDFTGAELTDTAPANDLSQQYTARFQYDGLTTWYDIVGRNKDLIYDFAGTDDEPDWETVTEGTGRTFTNADGYIAGVAVSPTGSDSRGVRYQNKVAVANADIVFRAEKLSGTGSAGVIFYDEGTGDWFGAITYNGNSGTNIRGFSSTSEFNSLSNRPFDADRDIEISFDGTNVTIRTQTTDNSAEYTTIINNVAITSPRTSYKVGLFVGATTDIELRLHELEFTRYEK